MIAQHDDHKDPPQTDEQLQTDDQSLLLSLSKDITSCRSQEDVQAVVSNRLAKYLQFTEMMVCLNSADKLTHSTYIHTVSEKTMSHPDFARGVSMKYFINDGIFDVIEASEEPLIFDMNELVSRATKPFYVDFWHRIGVKEIIGFPIRTNNECIGAMTLYPTVHHQFTTAQLGLLQAVTSLIGMALSNIILLEKIQRENLYLQEQIRTTYHDEAIIGSNHGMMEVFQLVSNVASSSSTVLLLGETGTGKELIARAIHQASPRKDKLMIKINCAALPANLIESELFGHERGSFTGAMERRIGKFEMASGSTLFLDEIGEMPLELQVKLLRAIQEKEIERIGGRTVIKTNVRIIAATNRNLKHEIESGKFRSDLFYRLNVFPITLPPLRERKEDIPALVSHFVSRYARRSGKEINNVAPRPIKEMMLYDWPGNVRELQHVIERSVLMTTGPVIKEIHLPKMDKRSLFSPGEQPIKSRKQNERDHIMAALKKSMGKVGGPGGAAEILNMPSTTLHSRIKTLGIRKEYE